ncbi:hypothetical protein GCM10022409_28080 [Hymenobacter glaciei]|uniref:Uncharacterized protein n=1 Tax=Hymenobacter glaciei TaxID=877209 RepID=A0ABP7UF24_9BACT
MAQAPEKTAPDDLVVTAEIVGYSRELGYKDNVRGVEVDVPPYLCLYAKMTVRNTTNHVRNVIMYNCEWSASWVATGPHGLFNATYIPSCGKNFVAPVPIPAGDALVFNCPLYVNGHIIKNGEPITTEYFKLGFVDYSSTDDASRSTDKELRDRVKIARVVYWSNALTTTVDPRVLKELTGEGRYFSYHYKSGRE